jgi:hypothetical protein
MPESGHERLDGVDRSAPRKDALATRPAASACPRCDLAMPAGAIRCPRCNALVLTGCGGSCASCGVRGCPSAARG